MKIKILAFFFLLFGFGASDLKAQEAGAADDCKKDQKVIEQLSVYGEYVRAKNYKDAYPTWKKVKDECPTASINLYIHGPKILDWKIKQAKTEEEKQAFTAELMKVYDDRNTYFPGKEGYVLGLKGSDMLQYKFGTSQEAFDVLHQAFQLDGDKLSASALYSYFTAGVRLFNEKVFGPEEIFTVYEDVLEAVESAGVEHVETIAKYEQMEEDGKTLSKKEAKTLKFARLKLKASETVEANVEKIISGLATCDRLEDLYSGKFDERKSDINWVNGAVTMMSRKKCFSSNVFFKLVTEKNKLDPSASASRVAGLLSLSNKEYSKALDFYNSAIKLGDDKAKKADDYYKAAQALFKLNRKVEARKYAYSALELKPNWGEPYILIGDMYVSSFNDCGDNEFEKKAVFWAAVDKYLKARTVDPKVSKKAAAKIKDWSQQAPNKALTFQFGYIGKPSYTIDKCWIKETVKIPFQN